MTIKEIRHTFFSLRNGIVAQTFHDAGDPHPRIFGLQIPQLAALAREAGIPNQDLAAELWADRDCREARLLACWLMDPRTITIEDALRLAAECISREETDILCFRLLRHLPFAAGLAGMLDGYAAEALRRNLE